MGDTGRYVEVRRFRVGEEAFSKEPYYWLGFWRYDDVHFNPARVMRARAPRGKRTWWSYDLKNADGKDLNHVHGGTLIPWSRSQYNHRAEERSLRE